MRGLAILGFVAVLAPCPAGADCRPLTITVPGLEHTTRHDVAVSSLEDFGGTTLDPVFDKLAQLARGTRSIVRIGIYGDSNWTNDRTAGEIRRRLQQVFGDAGHGWVAFGSPWAGYRHANVRHGSTGRWTSWSLTAGAVSDRRYSFGGSSAESSQAGATVWVETAKTGDPVGTAASVFEVSYLARPEGGSFEVLIDGESRQVVETAQPSANTRYVRFVVADGAHRLTVRVAKGNVRLFGVTLEREPPGVIVDGIGMNALNPPAMLRMDAASMTTGLAHRNYDLLVEATGTMVWLPNKFPDAMPTLIARWRAALPDAALMLLSPPDFVAMHRTPAVSEAYMGVHARYRREVARTAKIAFWDQYASLGGAGSAPKFHKAGWDQADGVHVGPKLSAYIAERFVHAILAELARRAARDPKLGCH